MAAPALAQTQAPAQAQAPLTAEELEDAEVEELVIQAQRIQPGAVIGDIPPELQFAPRDLRALGASTVTELLDALEPQISSARGGAAGGRPNVLVNGARVSSFAEVRDLPTEAILRMDILPEEVALKYGYRADQRVVNMVLRPRFRAITAEGSYRAPWEAGGGDIVEARANWLSILRGNRLMVDARASAQSRLYESDRDLAQPRSDAPFRTLIPKQDEVVLNAVLSRPLGNGIAATVNASVEASQGLSLLGLDPTAPRALERRSEGVAGHLGAGVAGAFRGWRWNWTGNLDQSTTDNETERAFAGARRLDTANSVSTSGDTQLDVSGSLFHVPAGMVSTTVTGAFATARLKSESVRAGVARSGRLSRDIGSAKMNIDVPLTSRRNGFLDAIGDLSVGFNAGVDQVSDFGALGTIGATTNWAPFDGLRFIGSFTRDEGAPTQQQLNDPEQATPLVQAYDFSRGETVLITRIDGGNPNLAAREANVLKFGINVTPIKDFGLTLSANYIRSRTDNLISSFPTASTQIEAAFPERFLRDATGRLVQIDARPVNFDKRQTEELRTGFTFRKTFGAPPPRPGGGAGGFAGRRLGAAGGAPGAQVPREGPPPGAPGERAAAAGQAPPPGAAGPGAGGPGGGFGGGPRGPGGPGGFGGGGFRGPPGGFGALSRQVVFQIGLYHTVRFEDLITIRPGVAPLDLLDGASIGTGGGTPRNQLDLQSNLTRGWLGGGLNARWRQGTVVRPLAGSAGQDLIFSDLTTVNLRLFADIGALPSLRRNPWTRATRLTLSIDNLFDQKQQVRARDGTTPMTYQDDYQDPRGRVFRVALRKQF
jgi:hypothetical protein